MTGITYTPITILSDNVKSDELTPGPVGDLLGEAKGVTRLWYKAMTLRSNAKGFQVFSRRDLFVLYVMKTLHSKKGVSNKRISESKWDSVCTLCNGVSFRLLTSCYILLKTDDDWVYFLTPANDFNRRNLDYTWLHLGEVYNSFIKHISDDVTVSKFVNEQKTLLSLVETIQPSFVEPDQDDPGWEFDTVLSSANSEDFGGA